MVRCLVLVLNQTRLKLPENAQRGILSNTLLAQMKWALNARLAKKQSPDENKRQRFDPSKS
jgi:hypothetical protein